MSPSTVEHFSGDQVAHLRSRARQLSRPPKDCPEGWSRRLEGPHEILSIFKSLHLKPGFVLRAYQNMDPSGNGIGIVWALPASAEFPEPDACIRLEDRFGKPPRPPQALDAFMEVIDGDGTPLSFLSASLLSRELHDFGSAWHGVGWGNVSLLSSDPWSDPSIAGTDLAEVLDGEWEWQVPKPDNWQARVEVDKETASVSFIGYSGLAQYRIFQITDRYKVGSYVFEWDKHDLALGPDGWIP